MKKENTTDGQPFTMERALAIQEEHLQKWEKILKPEVATKLRILVLAQNAGVTNPYDVCRGTDIDQYVHNAEYYNLV